MRRNADTLLTALLSVNFGLVFLDRNALNYLMPFVGPDLRLDNSQIGMLAGATALSWALSGFAFSALSDRIGARKPIIVAATVAFSCLSIASGFATGFVALLLTRIAMGLAEGPVLPLSQAMVAVAARPERRGLLMGIMNNFGSNLLGVMIAPPLLVMVATMWGWRAGFWIAGLPGLILAIIIHRHIREPAPAAVGSAAMSAPAVDWRSLLVVRNLWLCTGIACCMLAWTLLGWAFLPIYFVRASGFSPETMGWLMATLGAAAVVASILVPSLSDRIGRKPAVILFAAIGMVTPLAIGFSGLTPPALGVVIFLGWLASGTLPLFMATIPAESIDTRLLASAMAIVMGAGEIVGGAVMPVVAGLWADSHGLISIIWIQAGCAGVAALLGLFLIETAPYRNRTDATTITDNGVFR